MEEILRTRGHDEVARRPCRRDGLPNALNRMFEGVDRLILAAAGILDRSAGETRPDGRFHQAPAFQWLVVESRSEAHTSELQSLMRTSYAVFCLKKNTYKSR